MVQREQPRGHRRLGSPVEEITYENLSLFNHGTCTCTFLYPHFECVRSATDRSRPRPKLSGLDRYGHTSGDSHRRDSRSGERLQHPEPEHVLQSMYLDTTHELARLVVPDLRGVCSETFGTPVRYSYLSHYCAVQADVTDFEYHRCGEHRLDHFPRPLKHSHYRHVHVYRHRHNLWFGEIRRKARRGTGAYRRRAYQLQSHFYEDNYRRLQLRRVCYL